jgi:predicted NUDIX family NTP pyrophosphohydrolase
VHPGGPFWAKRDTGVWSIPKGAFEENEFALETAKREVEEETGIKANGNLKELNPVKQKGGKTIYAWARERNIETTNLKRNTFEIEWPPKSGEKKLFLKLIWLHGLQ